MIVIITVQQTRDVYKIYDNFSSDVVNFLIAIVCNQIIGV